ncbi:MAG: hypothetical protein JWO50_384 [Candidatus Kaiserbacteria bacterium]|nr:hypothetical protein [Candidatus Kaiserbacteria bacterium]
MLLASSFTFGAYEVNRLRSEITFTYRIKFKFGITKTFTDRLLLPNVTPELWEQVPQTVLEPTLQALLLILGINYWCAFPARNMRIEGFVLSRAQADFWNSVYLHGLSEFFYDMQIDFHNLIAFPYDESFDALQATRFERPRRALLLNGAGKDSILSAEILKQQNIPFDLLSIWPSPAHDRIATIIGAQTVVVDRRYDPLFVAIKSQLGVSGSYPSVTTFTFIATLLAELLGYDSIQISSERSADFGNLTYLGLPVNHQWCKSTEAEKMVNDYIQHFITPGISTNSLLREYSELEIVRRFVKYPEYLPYVTSCNNYFWLPRFVQRLSRTGYWCNKCPKCIFLFACFSAFLRKNEVVRIFGADLYMHTRLAPLFRRILGVEGFKPLDCVGEPQEMILAMHMADLRKEYEGEPVMQLFKEYFPKEYDFSKLETEVLSNET